MRLLLGMIHSLVGLMMLGVGLMVLGDYWKTPAFVLLAGGVVSGSIGLGVLLRARFIRWLIAPLVAVATLIAGFLLVGSIIWPESAALIIILTYVVFLGLEWATWHEVAGFRIGAPSP